MVFSNKPRGTSANNRFAIYNNNASSKYSIPQKSLYVLDEQINKLMETGESESIFEKIPHEKSTSVEKAAVNLTDEETLENNYSLSVKQHLPSVGSKNKAN